MRFAERHRRWLSLIAAYALALQGLVTAFAAPALAVAAAGPVLALCDPGGSQPGGDPAAPDHHDACLCCLVGHCTAGFGCASAGSTVSWSGDRVASTVVPLRAAPSSAIHRERPHNSRAPPLA